MKLIVFGNHTCGNRGDSAILRGLISEIEATLPDAVINIKSRYPVSSTGLLGREVGDDPFYRWHRRPVAFVGRRINKFARWAIPTLMALAIRTGWKWPVLLLPTSMQEEISRLRDYDIAIQVGGSFFIDLYGPTQFEYSFAAILSGRPLLLLGHSMGPFDGYCYRWLSATLLNYATAVALREPVSHDLIIKNNLPADKLLAGSDTAWLVKVPRTHAAIDKWLPSYCSRRPIIGITVRDISRFAARLGTSQAAYESAFALLINDMIKCGYEVIAASTCTAIGGYHSDDRVVALRIAKDVEREQHFHVVMGEPNDIELGQLLAHCELVVSTRLHGAIIAMNFGTPALAISYEHKSNGIMQQLGDDNLSPSIQSLLNGTLSTQVQHLLKNMQPFRQKICLAVRTERSRARSMLEMCVSARPPL